MVEISNYSKESQNGAAANVSTYLSLTAVSIMGASYLGGYLLNFLSVRQVFMINCLFPLMPLLMGLRIKELSREKFLNLIKNQNSDE